MLHRFPAEIALQTISSLPLYSLCSTTLVSRQWNALIATNEPTVYRNAALLHRFINNSQLSSGADAIIADWKAYCRRQLEIERGWRGRARPVVQELKATGPVVHRIKVDYEFDLVITTCQIGGLFVCDIKSDRILWALPPSHVALYVHVEYDNGYIVFNRYDNYKEVWRHSIDVDGDQHSETSPPDKKMVDISMQAASRFNSMSRRGHFTAWALLRMPEECRLFRVSYPNLLAVATSNAYTWDLPTMQLVSVIRDLQRNHQGFKLGSTSYAEVNNMYAFICGQGGLGVFSRKSGTLVYQLSSKVLSGAIWDVRPQTRRHETSLVHPQILRRSKQPSSSPHGSFMACHVSASGKDLAILTTNSRVVLLPDFRRLFSQSKNARPQDIAIILNFQPPFNDEYTSFYLAVGGHNGKLAVAMEEGIYVISPDFDFTRLTADRPPEPGVTVCRLSQFEHDQPLSFISCLQITHDAVYVTYRPTEGRLPAGTNTVYTVRF